MKIERIEIFRVDMPLVYPFRTAFGDNESIESLFVRFTSGGASGWGESAPWRNPAYSPECAETAFVIMKKFLAPLLLGKDIESGQQLQELLKPVKGNHFAKAAFDIAWWELHARMVEKPLWEVLGGSGILSTWERTSASWRPSRCCWKL